MQLNPGPSNEGSDDEENGHVDLHILVLQPNPSLEEADVVMVEDLQARLLIHFTLLSPTFPPVNWALLSLTFIWKGKKSRLLWKEKQTTRHSVHLTLRYWIVPLLLLLISRVKKIHFPRILTLWRRICICRYCRPRVPSLRW